MEKELISPYSFPGIKKELLNKKKYPYLFSPLELKLSREDVMEIISKEIGVSVNMILSKCRETECVTARNIYYKILKLGFKQNYSQIAREMGKDHTTILWAIGKFDDYYKNEEDFREVTNRIFSSAGIKLDTDKILK
jgi:chromosomal replication initiation ATPase DnaA